MHPRPFGVSVSLIHQLIVKILKMSFDPSRMPSRKRYLVAVCILVGGMGLFAAILSVGLSRLQRSLTRFIVPGEATLRLSQPGSYGVFYEHQSRIGGQVFSTAARIQGVTCNVDSVKEGSTISLNRPEADFSYNWKDEFSGYKVFTFDVGAPGDYHIACLYNDPETKVVFAVARDAFGAGSVFLSLAFFFGGIIASLWMGVRTYSARKAIRYFRQMQLANPVTIQTPTPTSQPPFSD